MMSLLAVATMISCSKDDLATNVQVADETAFVNLAISTPTSRAGVDQDATAEENAVNSVLLLVFDEHDNYISSPFASTSITEGGVQKFQFKVATNAHAFFAVVNPNSTVQARLEDITGGWNSVLAVMQTAAQIPVSDLVGTSDSGFVMVNTGTMGEELVYYTGELSTDEDNPTDLEIEVDRMAAKATIDESASFVVLNGEGEINGFALNVTNRLAYLYSTITLDNLGTGKDRDYRSDPNMRIEAPSVPADGSDPDVSELLYNFNWLHNDGTASFAAMGSTEYVIENTAGASYYNYNNLTQVVVEAVYTPKAALDLGINVGESWFAINIDGEGTVIMDFDDVVAYYGATTTKAETKTSMDIQLTHILGTSSTWNNTSLAALDAVTRGGYMAATVENEEDYIVQYYQHSLNYYDVFIQHDSNIEPNNPGRWGMVRNNAYEVNINSLSGSGLPYVPDPTDPDIVDPQNPDPTDPEPADEESAYIDVEIVVNPWTLWSQDVDLN